MTLRTARADSSTGIAHPMPNPVSSAATAATINRSARSAIPTFAVAPTLSARALL